MGAEGGVCLNIVMKGVYEYRDAFSLSVETHLKLPGFCNLHRERILKAGKDLERVDVRGSLYKALMSRWERAVQDLENNRDNLGDEYYIKRMDELNSVKPLDPMDPRIKVEKP